MMTVEEHKQKHKVLHKALDELTADYMHHTDSLPSSTTLMDLMEWSYEQTKNPTVWEEEVTPINDLPKELFVYKEVEE